jgi:hypothetical protein
LPAEHTADDEDGGDQATDYCICSPSIHFSHLDPPKYLLMDESSRDISVPVLIVQRNTRGCLAAILVIET